MLIVLATPALLQAETVRSFSLSTNKTYAPGEKPNIHLYAQGEDVLEFRIYHVQDPVQFFSGLNDLHNFGRDDAMHRGPEEKIDEETWLERFHDWKHHIWFQIRQFFRFQVSENTRDVLRRKQAEVARRDSIVGVAEFAQIPILNQSQLVARWRQNMPPTFVSDSQDLPIDPLPAGLYLVEATDAHYKAYTLLMISNMVLITRTGTGSSIAYTADRRTGQPIPAAQVTIGLGHQPITGGQTDKDGVLDLKTISDLPINNNEANNLWVLATNNGDVAAVTPWAWSFSQTNDDRFRSYVYTDRPIYRPGHTVHWKAILRQRVENHLEVPPTGNIHVRITDNQNKALFDKQMPLSAMGTLNGDLTLASDAGLGYYQISVAEMDAGSFQVQEYRKPEYQVKVQTDKPRLLEGEKIQATIDSRYFFGEPVAGAKVKYRVYHSPHYWWGDDEDSANGDDSANAGDASGEEGGDEEAYDGEQESEQEGRLDANGKLTVTVPTRVDDKNHEDYDYTLEASVTDEANREITGRGHFLATYGNFRIGVEPASYITLPGQATVLNVTALDYDNMPVKTLVHIEAVERKYENGQVSNTRLGTWDAMTDAQGRAQVRAMISNQGTSDVEFTVSAISDQNRSVQSTTYVWMLSQQQSNSYDLDYFNSQQMQIVADKKTYAPGDTAHLCLIGQESGFYALVTASGSSLTYRKVLHSDGRTLNFDMPIDADSQPNLQVNAIVLENGQLYRADKQLKVPPVQKQLQVTITPSADTFQPQQTVSYDVNVVDWQKKPVTAELSFGAVDEAIYSIEPDTSGDIASKLYPQRGGYFDVSSSLTYEFSGEGGLKSPLLAKHRSAFNPRMAQVKPGQDLVQPKVRKAFPDTAFWAPSIHTDANGHAKVQFAFPDSLTTWRATVRAITADSEGGSSINRIVVRKNILVRMGTPRFLRRGDEITLPVIVHNYTDQPRTVTISLDVAGLDILAGQTQQIPVASKGDTTVRWRLKASNVGTASLTAKALTTVESDALQVSFPVEPAGVMQSKSASGVVYDTQQAVPVNFPAGIDSTADTLRVDVSGSVAGSIFSALQYLTSYPYGCTEQTMSSFMPDVIVAQTLKKVKTANSIDPAVLKQQVAAGLTRLYDYQHGDGGWGWWKEDDSRVFMTAYVVAGMAQAETAGYNVDGEHLQHGKTYLRSMVAQHPNMLPDLRAYVTWAMEMAGEVNAASVNTLWDRRNDLDNESLAMLGMVLSETHDARTQETASLLEKRAAVDDVQAHWDSKYDSLMDFEYDDSVKATALALKFLVHADPKSDLLPKAAQWLVANRDNGYWWDSTLQTAFALYGLTDYVSASQELDANFDAEVLVNGVSAGKRHFSGAEAASGATLHITLNASQLQAQSNTVQVIKHGKGRAYFSVQGTYYSTDPHVYQQGTMQLNLVRDYYRLAPVTTATNTIEYELQPLRGPVKVGDIIAVHIAVAGSPQKYLMIEDPIPAGTEFVTHEESYNIRRRPDDWNWWYTRREFHDDRAVIFSTEFSKRQDAFYLLQVVNPGSFNISPASVQPMYQHGVQATSDAKQLEATQ